MNDNTGVENFYQNVAEALGACHKYREFPFSKRTRWNNRSLGNGRFQGFGIVRRYGADNIHVQLHTPAVNGVFRSEADALNAIRAAVANQPTSPS